MDYSSVPTSADLENNSNTKKYTVNERTKGKLLISKLVCFFLVMGAILLALLAALTVFILLPPCSQAGPQALTSLAKAKKEKDAGKNINTLLPTDLRPVHYKIDLMPFLQVDNFTTHGYVSIEFDVSKATDKLVININDIEIDDRSVRIKHSKTNSFMGILDQSYNKESQIYTVIVNKKMNKGEHYKFQTKFVGKLNDLNQGFYRSSYYDSASKQTRWLASTQFSPTDARRAFPCFDEPSYKATFSISIARPSNMTSLSNMPIQETTKSNEMDNYLWDHFKETKPMSTYLVAFIVSDLQPFEFHSDGKLFTIWTRKEAIGEAIFASEIAPKLLNFFEHYFNIPYPLPKIDMVAVPDFGFSAMENWGLITFRESSLLLDAKTGTIKNKRSIALVMAHEIAHQWFGNLATPKFWDDLWLKEGFATYFEYIGVDQILPEWNITNEFLTSEVKSAFSVDSYPSARPLSIEITNNNEISQVFDSISYSKGSAVIRMIQNILGEDAFKSGLIHFLNNHQYANADHDGLWTALTEKAHAMDVLEANITVKDIMDSWVTQPGFPVVTAIANYEDQKVELSQKRFLLSGEVDEEPSWWIPISYTTRQQHKFDDSRPQTWLKTENDTEIILDTRDWYLINLKHTGYYIVNYDEINWKKLIAHFNEFPVLTKAQLLSNSMDLARANLLDYDIPFKIVWKSGRNNELITTIVAFDKIQFLYDMLITTPIFNIFDVFLLSAFQQAFDNVGINEIITDSYSQQMSKDIILTWACKKPDSRCTNEARHMFRTWMVSINSVPNSMKGVVYCTAIREGGETEWEFAYSKYLETNLVAEKNDLLDALGCTMKPWILIRYLNMMLDEEYGIRKQEGARVFASVAKNIAGHSLAFDFLRSNWKNIYEYYGGGFNRIGKMVQSLTTYMNSPYQLAQLESFKQETNLGTAQQAFEHAIETVKANVDWMSKSYENVDKWLEDHRQHFGL